MMAAALCVTLGCATGSPSTFSSLSEQGLLSVSSDNPFVGANIFLASEMEESRYLYNFVKEKGAPQAIELSGRDIADCEMKLFYSGRQEMYSAVPQFDRSLGTKEWIVRGPYALDRSSYRQVSSLVAGQGGVFQVFGRREVLGGPVHPTETRVIAPVFIEPPAVKPQRRKIAAKPKHTTTPVAVKEEVVTTPSNLDQEAIAEFRRTKKEPEAKGAEPGISVSIGSSTAAHKTPAPTATQPAKASSSPQAAGPAAKPTTASH